MSLQTVVRLWSTFTNQAKLSCGALTAMGVTVLDKLLVLGHHSY